MDVLTSANLLAWAIQAGVVILVSAPLPRLLGLWSPRVRMAYWRVVLVTCLMLPLLQPWAKRPEPAPAAAFDVAATTDVVAAPGTPTLASTPASAATAGWRLSLPIGGMEVLIAGIVLRLGWLGLGVITVGRLRRSARRLWPRPASIDRAASLAETDAEFLVSATTSRPVTCGLLWPVVLVPRNFETFPEHEQTAIACHELLHVSRADWVRNAADELVRAVFWFHPAIWWLINQIQLAREQVVDREAVRRLGARQPYLAALLRMARPAPRLILTPASLFLKRAHLRQRVSLLVKEVSVSKARLVTSCVVMAIVMFAGGRLVTSAFPLQQAGARTPGVQTAAPKLPSRPIPFDLVGTTGRAALAAFSQATGIAVSSTDVLPAALDREITVRADNAPPEQILALITKALGLGYRVVSERAVVITGKPGSGWGSSGTKPGVSTGIGVGVGSGTGPGVAGGVTGGVVGGVQGGVLAGVVGGVNSGIYGGVTGGVTSATRPPGINETVTVGGQSAGSGADEGLATRQENLVGFPSSGSARQVLTRVDPPPMGEPGPVVVRVRVDPSGGVSDAEAVSGANGSAAAAVDAARLWVFEPGPVQWTTYIGFTFIAQVPGGTSPVRVGGNVRPPRKVADHKPVYPKAAQQARVQGVQIIGATIGPSGDVIDAWALRGQEELIPSAIDAVLHWRFEPAQIDGTPVPMTMTVTVNFTLGEGPTPAMAIPPREATAGRAPESTGVPVQYGAATDWPPDALRVGGEIKPPAKTVDVKAVYPNEAQKARVQGVVICDVLIGPDGKVKDARLRRSIPLLDQSAVDAVRQWEFTPTLLNGNPVSVIMTVTVNFTLQ